MILLKQALLQRARLKVRSMLAEIMFFSVALGGALTVLVLATYVVGEYMRIGKKKKDAKRNNVALRKC